VRTWVYVTSLPVSTDHLRHQVEALGGYWVDDMNRGVITRGDSALYIDPCGDLADEFESDELASLGNQLGGPPIFGASIGLSRRGEPDVLAEQFSRAMIDRWGGVLRRE
jgi:hypothetical protein